MVTRKTTGKAIEIPHNATSFTINVNRYGCIIRDYSDEFEHHVQLVHDESQIRQLESRIVEFELSSDVFEHIRFNVIGVVVIYESHPSFVGYKFEQQPALPIFK